jgi:hypothetical protein
MRETTKPGSDVSGASARTGSYGEVHLPLLALTC